MASNFFISRILASHAYQMVMAVIIMIMIGIFIGIHPLNYGLYEGHALWRMTFVLVSNGDSSFSFLSTTMHSMLPLFILGSVTLNQINDHKSGFNLSVIARLGQKKHLQQLYIGSGIMSALLFVIPLIINHLVVFVTKLLVSKTYVDPLNADVMLPLKTDAIWQWGVWSWQHLIVTDLVYSILNTWLFILFGTLLVSLALLITKTYQLVLLTLAMYLPFWGGSYSVNKLMQPIVPAYIEKIMFAYIALTVCILVINVTVYRYFAKQVI
ncbi:hypothetical protein AB3K25_09720 [Leuconostoc sp. MS02]|uniref:Uncharacterized protein n=1 Tax=Leuconostoc aquikimchii TaxID=3236804 RepID=A0ABV3S282_9LACO